MDGVLADLAEMVLRIYHEDTGVRVDKSLVTEWEFWTRLGLSRRDFISLMVRAWNRWEEMRPLEEDIAEDTEELCQLATVEIFTQRPADTIEPVKKWLRRNGVKYHGFKWVPLKSSKSYFLYDVYIDDSPRLAEQLRRLGRRMMLYNQPWNASILCSDKIVRVNSLDECVGLIGSGVL